MIHSERTYASFMKLLVEAQPCCSRESYVARHRIHTHAHTLHWPNMHSTHYRHVGRFHFSSWRR